MKSQKLSDVIYRSLSEIALSDEDIESRYFEVLKAGKKVYQGSVMEITQDMLHDLADNFQKNVVGTQLALDVNHDPEHKAYAWVADVKVEGDSLWMKFKDFSEEGSKLVKEKMYKYFSVEFQTKFENVIDGIKKTFKNVLRGIALTNRPVDKAIQPTFLSEDVPEVLIFNELIMFKKLLAEMQKKKSVSKEDFSIVKALFSDLPEEEKEEVKEDVENLEAKVETEVVEEKQPEELEKKAEELAEKKYASKLSELQADLDKEKNFRRFSETSNEVKNISFGESSLAPVSQEAVVKFLMTLSEEKAIEGLNVIKALKTVDLSEHGSAGEGDDEVTDDQKVVEAYMAENQHKFKKLS